jgi:hypothetical protein
VSRFKWVFLLSGVLLLCACDYQAAIPPSSTPLPTKTETPTATSTITVIPPTETPTPSPTIPPDIWLDTNSYELQVQHPASTAQPEWESVNEIIIPADGMVGGFVFTVSDVSGIWSPAVSQGVEPANSILRSGSMRDSPPGDYCISDYFSNYNPLEVCQWLAPDATQLDWITPYFAGPKTEVGVAFNVGGCDPASCTAYLQLTNIRLIYFSLPE